MEYLGSSAPNIDWDSPDLEGSWKRFISHCEFVFNGPLKSKDEAEKCNYLMIWVGEKGRRIYETWTLTAEEKKTLKTYTDRFAGYVKPRTNIVYNRFKFGSRVQNQDESFDQFVTELQILVKDCAYDKDDEMVRDRIVFGIRNNAIREKLINKGSELTLTQTLEIARAYEISKAQSHLINTPGNNSVEVNAVRGKGQRKSVHKQVSAASSTKGKCTRCGRQHEKNQCPAIGKTCNKCHRTGHFASVCRSKQKPQHREKPQVHNIDCDSDSDSLYVGMLIDLKDEKYNVNALKDDWYITAHVNNKPVKMMIDTGAKCNVMSSRTLKELNLNGKLDKGTSTLKSHTGHQLPSMGTKVVECHVRGKSYQIKFQIVDIDAETILGADTSESLELVCRIYTTQKQCRLVEEKYPQLFEGLGKLPGVHKIQIDSSIEPVIHSPRKVPVALRDKVKMELDKMEKIGVIKKQEKPTKWVNSMVTVVKPNNKIRICIDPRDLNKAILREHHPMKTIEEILPQMSEAKVFSKLDALSGFWQCALDEASQELCTMNTPYGRYSFTRLPFGVKSAPEVYQKIMSELVQHIEGCEAIIDDLVIWGKTVAEHDERLEKVLHSSIRTI